MPGNTVNDDLHPPAEKDADNPGMSGGTAGLGTGTGGVDVNEGAPTGTTASSGHDETFTGPATSGDPLHPGPDDDADNDGLGGGAVGLGTGVGGVTVSEGSGTKKKKDKGKGKKKDKGKGGGGKAGKKSGDPMHPGPGDDASNPGIKGGPPKLG